MINNFRKYFLPFSIVLLLIISFDTAAFENQMVLTHLTTDDGLSQNTVVSVHKDKKGLLWFGTWDGLNKYDGYRFTVYKSNQNPDDENSLLQTRVDWIKEDKFGFLWVKTYDDLLYRFDPSKEYFLRVSGRTSTGYEKINDVWILDNGEVWCSLQKGGYYKILTNSGNKSLTIKNSIKIPAFKKPGNINHIFLDDAGNTWILAQQGLARQIKGNSIPSPVFKEISEKSEQINFVSYLETSKNLFFGTTNGDLWVYDKRDKFFKKIETDFKTGIYYLQVLSDRRIFVGSRDNGFMVIELTADKSEYYSKEAYPQMKSNKIFGAFSDDSGNVWISLDIPGVLLFNSQSKSFSYLLQSSPNTNRSLSPEARFFVFKDIHGTFWVHTREGSLFTYNKKNNSLDWFHNKPGSSDCIFRSNIQVAYSDREGVLWVCSGNQGVYKCVKRNNEFNYTSMEPWVKNGTPDIRSLFVDPAGNIWVSSKAGELRLFDKNMKSMGVLCHDGVLRSSGDNFLSVYKILMDSRKRVWLATKGQGLIMLKPKNSNFNSFDITFFVKNPTDPYSISNNKLYDILEDGKGRIWVASYDGGLNLLEETGGKIRFLHSGNKMKKYPFETFSRVRCLVADKKGNIWVGTTNGLLAFRNDFNNVEDINFISFGSRMHHDDEIFKSDIYDIICDSRGWLWMGTFGRGLLACKNPDINKTPELIYYNQKNGFHTDIVLSLVEDRNRNIWLTSENTIARFDPVKGNRDLFNSFNGLESVGFLESSVFNTDDGKLLFGNASGFYFFDPLSIKLNGFKPGVVFTRLQLFGRNVQIGVKGSPLKTQLEDCKVLKLNHKQKTFNIEFAALDFQTPENVQYEYRLDGYEEEWNIASKQRIATYTGLPKGKYRLLVKSTNSDGLWSDNIKSLDIEIMPSFWQTGWAYLMYVLLGLLLIAAGIYMLLFYLNLKNKVVIEQKMTDLKLRFFTDISHELRTPLTLISSPVENIINNEDVSQPVRHQLQIVQKNTERMTRLLNQILDFRKLQYNNLRLRIEETLLVDCVRKSCSHFDEIAREQNIDFRIVDDSNGVLVWLDQNALDTIIFNLVSNSFKFTPEGKSIIIYISVLNNEAIVRVEDQGIGISKSLQSRIFERFFTLDESYEASKRSTGIGLSLVKELVTLHGATINVTSAPGEGTRFEVRFKLGAGHFGDNVDYIIDDSASSSFLISDSNEQGELNTEQNLLSDDTQMVLILEDNKDLCDFLRTVLSKKFRVAETSDAVKAWEMTQSLMPDFILTDLMLSGMTGKEFIKLVKNDDRTCHIPVVVLTAVANLETKLECLDMGADDYITKPFSATFLEARIHNMLEQKKRMQTYYRDNLLVSQDKVEINVPMPKAHKRDDEFMDRLMSVMESNISNGSFTVDQLCTLAGYGRTVFFNKLKSLTGLSPNEYIREVRIKRAAQLLEVGEYTISQITYMVGMNDSRYFSKCFKQKYNMTPTEYRDKYHLL
jgi:signal transduction histidine kinase/ligand-binding sensor domain-containing protein/DNA-binding response OmpR family regulator